MTWSSRTTVRGRIEAGVQPPRAASLAWQLEELELPAGSHDIALDLESAPAGAEVEAVARETAERRRIEDSERAVREAALRELAAKEAFARGHAEGVAEGRAAAVAELAETRAMVDALVAQLREQEQRLLQNLEENLAALAVGVARHVVGREVRQDPTVVADLVRRALAEFPVDQPVRVRVHPLDLSALSAATTADGAPIEVAPTRDLTWLADPRVQRGGAVLEGRERVVDGRVDLALERVFRRLGQVSA